MSNYLALAASLPQRYIPAKPDATIKRRDSALELYEHHIDPDKEWILKESLGLYVRPFGVKIELLLSSYLRLMSKQLIGAPLAVHPLDLKTQVDRLIADNGLESVVEKAEFIISGERIQRYLFGADYRTKLLEALRPFSNDLLGEPPKGPAKVIPLKKGEH